MVCLIISFTFVKEIANSSNSPPQNKMLAMDESLLVIMPGIESGVQKLQIPIAISEVLYIKKNFSFCAVLQTVSMCPMVSNNLMKNYPTKNLPQLAKNQIEMVSANPTMEGLVIKKDFTNFSGVNYLIDASKRCTIYATSQSFQLSTVEGLCINEKVNSFPVNFTGFIA